MAHKRIGFVDDDLDNYHANTYLDAIRGPLADRGFVVAGVTALRPEAGRAWAAKKRVEYVDEAGQLASMVDCVAVLAPSTPDTHLGLSELVLPAGKPTFVDKTFAPDVATAEKIFALADGHGAPVQTASALRTTNVQKEAAALGRPLTGVALWAGGASLEEYAIHPVELAVSLFGPEAKRLTVCGDQLHPLILIEFDAGRVATIDFNPQEHVPFQAVLTTEEGSKAVGVDDSQLFVDAAAAILDFFDAGELQVPRDETMAVMRVLDGLKDPAAHEGWITL